MNFFSFFNFFKKEKPKEQPKAPAWDSSNTFVLIKEDGTQEFNPKIKSLVVKFYEKNGYVEIKEPISIKSKSYLYVRENGKVIIDKNCELTGTKIYANKCSLEIGKNTKIGISKIYANNSTGKKIKIGSDCLISHDAIIRCSDGHSIYDLKTKKLLNPSKNITIGNHCWIGQRVTILKGAKIPKNTVIGAESLVNKPLEKQNCVYVGNPVKIIKENVGWSSLEPELYAKEKI